MKNQQADRISLRALAAEAVADVLAGTSLDEALPRAQVRLPIPADRALLQVLCYGVLRDLRLLEEIARRLLDRPLKNHEHALKTLLLVGIYQMRSTRVPPHAAVAETVEAASAIGRAPARGLINATLRRYQREAEAIEASLPADAAIRESHPDWMVEQLRTDWADRWREILAANNQPGPMSLRVNLARVSRDAYEVELGEIGLRASGSAHAPAALTLDKAVPVGELPGFADGRVSVQDVAAQLAAPLLECAPGMRVLDACAAPGGKAAHILEGQRDIDLLALDRDAQRLTFVEETLRRLKLDAQLQCADAADVSGWWDDKPFDRILVDAPCSGTGVIRRHPDIKWLRRESDIAALAAQQRRLLDALWPLLAPGGLLLYASCSVFAAEGSGLIGSFLAAHADAIEKPIAAGWGEACANGRRTVPGQQGMDGFYYARLAKS